MTLINFMGEAIPIAPIMKNIVTCYLNTIVKASKKIINLLFRKFNRNQLKLKAICKDKKAVPSTEFTQAESNRIKEKPK